MKYQLQQQEKMLFYEYGHESSELVYYEPIIQGDSPFQGRLFPPKELYIQSCTTTGKFRAMMNLSPNARLKVEFNNAHLMAGMAFTQRYGFPIMKPCTEVFDFETAVPFSCRNDKNATQCGVHFFEDDYKFARPVWERLDQTIYNLRSKPYIFAPDHSMFVGPHTAENITAVFRSRFAGAFAQMCGYTVFPTASWGDVDSFSYCFDGLPYNSVIGVCGVGVDWCAGARELWLIGLAELERRLKPTLIVISGESREIPGIQTPVTFIPPYVKYKLRNRQYEAGK